jgi:hypothetical protein
MKSPLNNPPGCDWRTSKAHCGIDYGMPQPLPFFDCSLAIIRFAIMHRKSHEYGAIAQQHRPKRISYESGAIAPFRKGHRPFPKKNIIRQKRGLKSFDLGITICGCTDNQDQDRFERISG